jgi:hypothetical protein
LLRGPRMGAPRTTREVALIFARASAISVFFVMACTSSSTEERTDAAPDARNDGRVLMPRTPTRDSGATPSCRESDAGTLEASTCATLCGAVQAAACANAPTPSQCSQLCEVAIGRCPGRVSTLVRCLGPAPAFSCDATQNAGSDVCAAELTCVRNCVAQPSDAG